MPKNIDGVSLPERRKSIRNIPIPEGRRKIEYPKFQASGPKISLDGVRKSGARKAPIETEPEMVEATIPPRFEAPKETRSGNKRIWFAVAGAILVLIFAVLSFFNGATLSYTPRSTDLTFEKTSFSAFKSGGTGLIYSVVKLSADKGTEVPASGESDVSRKATGTIVVYNNSSETQKLVENTRFETTDGKVYRISKAITVPAKSGTTPGSVEAVVTADAPGQSYNIALSDFTLPGLKGSSKFELIYARSKSSMTGGFVGKEKTVNPQDLAKAKTSLTNDLKNELNAKALAEVPPDFVLFPALSLMSYEDLPQSTATNGDAVVNLRGNLYGIMFKRTDLANTLATGKVQLAQGEIVEIPNFETLNLSYAGATPTDLLNLNKIDLLANGQAKLVWRTDEVALKSDLLGRKKSDLNQILANYQTVQSASATISPFWKKSFPEDSAKITIKKLSIE